MIIDYAKFDRWEEETHIPERIMEMVKHIADKVGCGPIEEETLVLQNRGGYTYGYMKGFKLVHCTFSMADGPSLDYSKEMEMWLRGLGFKIVDSYGDNGMDPVESGYRDTYWTHEFGFPETEVPAEDFEDWDDDYEL